MSASLAVESGPTLTIPSRLFGPLQVPASSLVTFPDGIPGFAGERRFITLPAAGEHLYWLQDAGDAGIAFLTLDPFPFFADYAIRVAEGTELPAGLDEARASVLCVVTLPGERGVAPTVNLQAPILVDFEARIGGQLVQADARYHTRHPVLLPALRG